ncbi:MAG TPA: hypothetical protein VKC52_10670 [Acidimicrobiia bacterium]|nr:hypothetical protein [Acidimicrobiia bacterium]
MSVLPPTGINWVEAMQPLEARRRAQVIASFAEYLAEDVNGNPSRALAAVASLAEWCEGDHRLVARARADVLRDEAPTAGAERTKHDAVQLLDLVANAS